MCGDALRLFSDRDCFAFKTSDWTFKFILDASCETGISVTEICTFFFFVFVFFPFFFLFSLSRLRFLTSSIDRGQVRGIPLRFEVITGGRAVRRYVGRSV